MKRFECTVTRTDKYIIEFDENIIDEGWMKEYRKHFYRFNTLEEHAGHIAQFRARFDDHYFIEGYGVPLINGIPPWSITEENGLEKGINIIIESEDQECDVDVEEIKE